MKIQTLRIEIIEIGVSFLFQKMPFSGPNRMPEISRRQLISMSFHSILVVNLSQIHTHNSGQLYIRKMISNILNAVFIAHNIKEKAHFKGTKTHQQFALGSNPEPESWFAHAPVSLIERPRAAWQSQ